MKGMTNLKMATDSIGKTNPLDCNGAYQPCLGQGTDPLANLLPNTEYACIMVPVLEGYELVTDKEGRLPAGCMYYEQGALDAAKWTQSSNERIEDGHGQYLYIRPKETPKAARLKAAIAEHEATLEKLKAELGETR